MRAPFEKHPSEKKYCDLFWSPNTIKSCTGVLCKQQLSIKAAFLLSPIIVTSDPKELIQIFLDYNFQWKLHSSRKTWLKVPKSALKSERSAPCSSRTSLRIITEYHQSLNISMSLTDPFQWQILTWFKLSKQIVMIYRLLIQHEENWSNYLFFCASGLFSQSEIWQNVTAHSPPPDFLLLPFTFLFHCYLKQISFVQPPYKKLTMQFRCQLLSKLPWKTQDRLRESRTASSAAAFSYSWIYMCCVLILCSHPIPWTRAVHP